MDPVISAIGRAALAALFAQAALHKLRDPPAFAAIVRGYRLAPEALAPAIAMGLGACELALVVVLVTPGAGPVAGAATAALLGVYSSAIGVNLARGRRDVDCGCLGPGRRQPISGWLLVRNAVLVAAALACTAPAASRALGWLDGVTVAGGTAVVVLLGAAVGRLGKGAALARIGRSW